MARKMIRSLVLAAVAAVGVSSAARAGTVFVSSNPGVTQSTTALTNFQTFGDQMSGMLVTAYFVSGGSETKVWGATGVGTGAVFGSGWQLTEAGDSWNPSAWTLSNISAPAIVGLAFDGGPGRTVFDRTNPSPGTLGSGIGADFDANLTLRPYDIDAIYFNEVALNADPAVTDIYKDVRLGFTGPFFAAGDNLLFTMDTDNAVTDIVPEPASISMLALGAAGLFGRRRRA